ncbi:hypothetical protein [Thioclava sp. SK-1]|uniref:hypothetical protein n=1 Tax=Thioclava sp. SK-1 TaxID=1889770 RepID=UPI00114D1A42|nr:hypothetical protein [Thioclava sp. SK-1]
MASGAGVAIIDRLSTLAALPGQLVSRPLDPTRWVVFGTIQHRESAPYPVVQTLIGALREQIQSCAVPGAIEVV